MFTALYSVRSISFLKVKLTGRYFKVKTGVRRLTTLHNGVSVNDCSQYMLSSNIRTFRNFTIIMAGIYEHNKARPGKPILTGAVSAEATDRWRNMSCEVWEKKTNTCKIS